MSSAWLCFPVIFSTPCRVSINQSVFFYSRCPHIFSNGCFVLWGWKPLMCCIDVGKPPGYFIVILSFNWKNMFQLKGWPAVISVTHSKSLCPPGTAELLLLLSKEGMHCSMFPVILRDFCKALAVPIFSIFSRKTTPALIALIHWLRAGISATQAYVVLHWQLEERRSQMVGGIYVQPLCITVVQLGKNRRQTWMPLTFLPNIIHCFK